MEQRKTGAAFCKGLGDCRVQTLPLGRRELGVLRGGRQQARGRGQARPGVGVATVPSTVLWLQMTKHGGSQSGQAGQAAATVGADRAPSPHGR